MVVWTVNMKSSNLLGICIGCIITKTNIHVCDVGYYVPTCFRHLCKMLDTMFQHRGTVQCALFHACLYALVILLRKPLSHILLTKQRAYLYIISCIFIPKGEIIFKGIIGYAWKFRKMFLLLRTFLICY